MKALLKKLLPESLKSSTRTLRAKFIASLAQKTNLTRDPLSHIYLKGQGVEYGALNWPLKVAPGVQIKYADFASQEDLTKVYPEHHSNIKQPDFVCSMERLETIPDNSLDFFIANHVIEHVEDPIQAFKSIFRVLKDQGIAFISLPDKRFTFDQDRPITTWEHLVKDHTHGPETSRYDHYLEWAQYYHKLSGEEAIKRAQEDLSIREDLHYHVWTQAAMLEMLTKLQSQYHLSFDLEALSRTGLETIFILKKHQDYVP